MAGVPVHPGEALRTRVATQCHKDRELRGLYREAGLNEFLGDEQNVAGTPAEVLSRFLEWHCLGEDGHLTPFVKPFGLIRDYAAAVNHHAGDVEAFVRDLISRNKAGPLDATSIHADLTRAGFRPK